METKTVQDETTTVVVISEEIKAKAQDILLAHNLNFNISKRKLNDEEGNNSGYFGLWNDLLGKCIHTVKDGYTVSQNKDIIEVVLAGIAPFGDKLRVTKAGSINEGRKVFVQIGIEGASIVGDNEYHDTVERFITVIDSNDGSVSLSVGIGDKTMSCQNQFWRFYASGSKFRHTATIEKKIKELPKLIEAALAQSIAQAAVYQEMFNFKLTPESHVVDALVKHLLGYDKYFTSTTDLSEKSTRAINKMDLLYETIYQEIAEKGWNLWGLHSGTTRFTTFNNSAPKRDNGRTESLMLGGGYQLNQQSLAFCYKKLGKAETVSTKSIAAE